MPKVFSRSKGYHQYRRISNPGTGQEIVVWLSIYRSRDLMLPFDNDRGKQGYCAGPSGVFLEGKSLLTKILNLCIMLFYLLEKMKVRYFWIGRWSECNIHQYMEVSQVPNGFGPKLTLHNV